MRGVAILLGVWLGKGLLMAIIGLFRPLVMLGWAVLRAAGMMLWLAATAVFAVAKALWGLVFKTIPAVIAAFARVGWAALAASGRFLWFAGFRCHRRRLALCGGWFAAQSRRPSRRSPGSGGCCWRTR